MNAIKLALNYELQGLKKEALEVYNSILKVNHENREAQDGVRRLRGERKSFIGVNKRMVDAFVSMKSDDDIRDFERWLIQIWN